MAWITILKKIGVTLTDDVVNETPLMFACKLGDTALAAFLIDELEANVNQQYQFYSYSMLARKAFYDDKNNGQTALHFACKTGNTELIKLLLRKGADPQLAKVTGERPIELIQSRSIFESLTQDEISKLMEPLEVTSEESSSLGSKQPFKYHNSEMRKHNVAMMVSGESPNGSRYIVLGRPRQRDTHFCFPGGCASPEDDSLLNAGLREFYEETSVDLRDKGLAPEQVAQATFYSDYQDKTTTIFYLDIGDMPINIYPCDDMLELRKVFLSSITFNSDVSQSEKMSIGGVPILGSNSLLIKALMLDKHLPINVFEDYGSAFKQQVAIEEEGNQLILKWINDCQSEGVVIQENTPKYMELEGLLQNHAFKKNGDLNAKTRIGLAMVRTGSLDGIKLLHSYGVDLFWGAECYLEGFGSSYMTPFEYAVATDNIPMVSLILSLDFIDKEYLCDIQGALHYALQLPDKEMFELLLSHGVNPNYSINEDLHRRYQVKPIFYEAIKKRNNEQVDRVISSSLVKLNQERSHKVHHSPLMVAIANRNEKAARKLIASCRVSLQYSAKESDDYLASKTNALQLAYNNGLDELAEIIKFFENRLTLKNYILKKHSIFLQSCERTEDENHKPTIHCYARSKEALAQLDYAVGTKLTIRQNNEGLYYVRLGKLRLQKLIQSKSVTNFLLNNCNNSPVFESLSSEAEKLLVQFRENTISNIDLNAALNESCFRESNAYKAFLMLLGENSSLEQISLNHDGLNFLDVMSTLHRHPGIKGIHFFADIISDMSQTEDGLSKLTTWLTSLPHLERVTFDYLPFNLLNHVFEAFAKFYDNKHLINIIVNEQYSDYELIQMSDMMDSMEVLHEISLPKVDSLKTIDYKSRLLSRQDECFQSWYGSDRRENHYKTHFMKVIGNEIYYQSILMSEGAQEIIIKYPGFGGQEDILDRIFASHPRIQSIKVESSFSGSELAGILHYLNQKKEVSTVTCLSISFCSLNAESLAQLTRLLEKGQFHYIDFGYIDINIENKNMPVFEKFLQILSSKDSLQVVKLSSMKANVNSWGRAKDLHYDIYKAVLSSPSIISADLGYGGLDYSKKLTLKAHLSENASRKRKRNDMETKAVPGEMKRNTFFHRQPPTDDLDVAVELEQKSGKIRAISGG